jgi:hypothetical protein
MKWSMVGILADGAAGNSGREEARVAIGRRGLWRGRCRAGWGVGDTCVACSDGHSRRRGQRRSWQRSMQRTETEILTWGSAADGARREGRRPDADCGVEQRVCGEVRRASGTEAERRGGLGALQHRSCLTKKRDGEPERDVIRGCRAHAV